MIAKAEPQGAYSCFITAFKHKPSHIMRTVSNILDQMTAAACNLQCLTRMLRSNLYFSSNVNTSFSMFYIKKKLILFLVKGKFWNAIRITDIYLLKCSVLIKEQILSIQPQMSHILKELEHVSMRPESNRFEISLPDKISLRCEITSLSAFTWLRVEWNSLWCKLHFGQIDRNEISNRSEFSM